MNDINITMRIMITMVAACYIFWTWKMAQLPKCDLVRRVHTHRKTWHLCHLLLSGILHLGLGCLVTTMEVFLLHVIYRLGNPMSMLWTGCIKLSLQRLIAVADEVLHAATGQKFQNKKSAFSDSWRRFTSRLAEVRCRILSKLDLELFSTCWTQLTTVLLILTGHSVQVSVWVTVCCCRFWLTRIDALLSLCIHLHFIHHTSYTDTSGETETKLCHSAGYCCQVLIMAWDKYR